MLKAVNIITSCFFDNPKQAIKEVLSLLAILACFAVLLYVWDMPEPTPGIQSAAHQAAVVKHLGVRR